MVQSHFSKEISLATINQATINQSTMLQSTMHQSTEPQEIPVETEEEKQRKLEEAELDYKQKTLFFLENWQPNKHEKDLVHL